MKRYKHTTFTAEHPEGQAVYEDVPDPPPPQTHLATEPLSPREERRRDREAQEEAIQQAQLDALDAHQREARIVAMRARRLELMKELAALEIDLAEVEG
ncbi:MAG TPA: hypothetical protein VFB62_20450 [Polyangiaceae bacterium]|nr:hypothetical protein [Polyangiaceae bacterium]